MAQQTVPASLPRRQTAIIADNSGRLTISEEVLLPELAPDEVLIRTAVVALNPSDTKFTGGMATPGANAGSDLAGVVVAIGSAVTDSRLSVGDRVCAPAVPMDALAPRAGAFAQFVSVPADFVLLVPEGMPLEQAAGLGTGLATVGYALFKSLGIVERLDKPAAQAKFVLVHGGSAATGTLAIQLIRR
jgi:NADPH:quinone reductase-like Zn-dependent oxidoreductase